MGDEDIWVMFDYLFFEMGIGLWISVVNVMILYLFQVLKGKGVKFQDYLKVFQLFVLVDEINDFVVVYDLLVYEYD